MTPPESAGTHESEMAAFLNPGLDLGSPDLSDSEAERYLDWCRRLHGEGNLDLVPFAAFFVEYDGAGLKRLRRHTGSLNLPTGLAVLMWVHTYAVEAFSKGVLYEVIAARELGVGKGAVLEVLRSAGLFGGPRALNAVGELTLPYLRNWEDVSSAPLQGCPTTWLPNPLAYRCGLDYGTPELSSAELVLIEDWHRQVHGLWPKGTAEAATRNPAAFKMARIRFEHVPGVILQAQVFPLLMLHTAVVQSDQLGVRRAGELARHCGVDDRFVAETVHWASAVKGPASMEAAFAALSG